MQKAQRSLVLQTNNSEREKSVNPSVGRQAICRIPSNHKQAERIVILAVNSGELQIDKQGRVWRLMTRIGQKSGGSRLVKTRRRRAEHRLPMGYLQVKIMRHWRRTYSLAHRLVWHYFNGEIPDGMCLNHKNGVKHDNRPANLEVVTYSENQKHAFATGLRDQHGERNPAAKLTDDEVVSLRRLYDTRNYTLQQLGEQFGLALQSVSKIIRGERRTKQAGPINIDNPRGQPMRDPETGRFISA